MGVMQNGDKVINKKILYKSSYKEKKYILMNTALTSVKIILKLSYQNGKNEHVLLILDIVYCSKNN